MEKRYSGPSFCHSPIRTSTTVLSYSWNLNFCTDLQRVNMVDRRRLSLCIFLSSLEIIRNHHGANDETRYEPTRIILYVTVQNPKPN